MTKFLRASTSLLASLALIATLVVVCPCPAGASDEPRTGAHDCCASEGITTADSCCDAGAAVQEGALVPAAATTLALPVGVQSATVSHATAQVVEHPAPAPSAFRSPPILRI
jgi:hypothetical protein